MTPGLPRYNNFMPSLQELAARVSLISESSTLKVFADADRLRREVRHVVLHEIAHHFGISDERLIELDRY